MTLDQLRLDVHLLTSPGGLLDQLAALLPEPVVDPTTGTLARHRAASSPPWHQEAATVWMDIHAGARALEQDLRYRVTGTWMTRGGSDANTRAALEAIPDLAAACDDETVRYAARQVSSWVRAAQRVRDIDQGEPWVPLPRLPGHLPPACPYCRTYSLRMLRSTGAVRCTNPDCRDRNGNRPRARVVTGHTRDQAWLAWDDGLQTSHRAETARETR